jgi:hypothetical protein
MSHTKDSQGNKVVEFVTTQDETERQLLNWIRGLVESNHKLVPALEQLRQSYRAILAGKPVTNADEVLWQVETALKHAEKVNRSPISFMD